jgi:hypothetical protein
MDVLFKSSAAIPPSPMVLSPIGASDTKQPSGLFFAGVPSVASPESTHSTLSADTPTISTPTNEVLAVEVAATPSTPDLAFVGLSLSFFLSNHKCCVGFFPVFRSQNLLALLRGFSQSNVAVGELPSGTLELAQKVFPPNFWFCLNF